MNHRRGHSPKHYKGVLSYKKVPHHRLSHQSLGSAIVSSKLIEIELIKANRNRINKSNRKYLIICNKETIKTSLCNRSFRKDRRLHSDTMQNTLSDCNIKSLRIIVTKTNRNSIRIKIKNRITKSLKITNNKIQRISAINCNIIGPRK